MPPSITISVPTIKPDSLDARLQDRRGDFLCLAEAAERHLAFDLFRRAGERVGIETELAEERRLDRTRC